MFRKRNKNADILLLAKEAIPVDIIGNDSATEERIAKISTADFELNLYSSASPE